MNEQLVRDLEKDFDHLVFSPDESRVVAWKNYGTEATVWDTVTGTKIVTIQAEMNRWYWSPNGKELISHDFRITNVWDATTGQYLRSIEAMYDISEE
ncbi:MAG: hypothetical protein JW779_00630 [Candidatus Thorarchaeota archaeon]|nr:hypothetical protein [Candidatus Thorarchaeota archaeon]